MKFLEIVKSNLGKSSKVINKEDPFIEYNLGFDVINFWITHLFIFV